MIIINLITLIVLGRASYIDLKTREIQDTLNILLFSIGTLLTVLTFINTLQIKILTNYLTILGIFTLISLTLYYTKQWGGGDTKLLIALSTIISTHTTPTTSLNYLAALLLSTLIYTIIATAYIHIQNFKKLKNYTKKTWKETTKIRIILYIITIISIITYITIPTQKALTQLTLPLTIIQTLLYLTIILTRTTLPALYKKINPQQLTEGDWATQTIKVNGKTIYDPKKDLYVNKKQLKQIKKLHQQKKLNTIKVKYGIPLAPAFLIAYATHIIDPNIINTIIQIIQ